MTRTRSNRRVGACLLAVAMLPGAALLAQAGATTPTTAAALQALRARFDALPVAALAPDHELLRATTAALTAVAAERRTDREFAETAIRLALAAVARGRADTAQTWLAPFDTALRGDGDARRRHLCAVAVGKALRSLGQPDAAQARLQAALAELAGLADARPAADDVRRVLLELALDREQWRDGQSLAAALVAEDRRASAAPAVLLADLSSLGICQHRLGERHAAFDAYEECLQIARSLTPPDRRSVRNALENLGAAKAQLGDYRGAYELLRESLEGRLRDEPEDSPDVLAAEQHLSQVLVQLGDLDNARQLQARVLEKIEDMGSTTRRIRATYAQGQLYFARILSSQRDHDGAREHVLEAIDLLRHEFPDNQRDLASALTLLGVLERKRDALGESRACLETAFATLSQCLTLDHNFTQIAASDLISTCRMQGDTARALELAHLLLESSLAAIRKGDLAARQTARLVSLQDKSINHATTLALLDVTGDDRQRLVAATCFVSQVLRGAAHAAARAAHHQSTELAAEISRLEREAAAASRAHDEARLATLVRDKESLERRRATAGAEPLPLPTLAALAKALPADAAAFAVVMCTRRRLAPENPDKLVAEDWYVAYVLLPTGEVELVDLGPRTKLLDLVDTMSPANHPQLRSLVLDRIRAATRGAKVLYGAFDDCLLLVPWDSLPTESGSAVGDEVEIRHLTSLLDLADLVPRCPPPVAATARLVAVGDVDYGARAPAGTATSSPPSSDTEAPAEPFAPLRRAKDEVQDVVTSFHRQFADAPAVVLHGAGATKSALLAALPGASIAHFATHGTYASERVLARTAAVGGGQLRTTAFELAPFTLSALALAGANATDATGAGADAGLLTAAELQHVDLDACYLAVLSACESGMGAWSTGQGPASLRESMHIAGARYVLATLWPVDDAAARRLVALFYEALWQQPDRPYRALRDAKAAARREGLSFADWAGFQLSGI